MQKFLDLFRRFFALLMRKSGASRTTVTASWLTIAVAVVASFEGLRTVAEGIERPTQLARLKDMHCDLGQGFHVGKPMPAEQVLDLLALEHGRAADAATATGTGWAS